MKHLLKYLLLLFFVFEKLVTFNSIGQLSTTAEYFINSDPGVGRGIPITGINGINVNLNVSILATGLQPGFNQLFIRVQDRNNNWSIADQRTFYIDNTLHTLAALINAEFFLDTDPGIGKGYAVNIQSGNTLNTLLTVNTGGLSSGFHQLFIRVKDQNNNWSIAEQRTFYIDNNLHALAPLNSAEYFVDIDPGVGNGSIINIQSGDTLNTLLNIKTAGFSSGFHQLFIRVKDQTNNWSIAEQRTFYIDANLNNSPKPLVAAEYFINTDAGVGNNIPVIIVKTDSVNMSYNYSAPNLPFGNYTMNLRVKDSTGNWSIVETRPFTVCSTYSPTSNFDFSIADSSVSFLNNSLYASTYYWNFGDGDTSNLPNPTHIYNKKGFYNACLISKNNCFLNGDTLCKIVAPGTGTPVSLVYFRLVCSNNEVLLSWQTATEINSSIFEIQKSGNRLNNWNTIGIVNATGNSIVTENYQFRDQKNNGVPLYRLRQVDKDGKFTYSEVLESNCVISNTNLKVYPIPAKNIIHIIIESKENTVVNLLIIDVYGQIIRKLNLNLRKGTNELSLNVANVLTGEYFLKAEGMQGLNVQKVVINH